MDPRSTPLAFANRARHLPSSRYNLGTLVTFSALALALGGILTLVIAVRLAPQLSTWRGRRLLRARWERIAQWEFWPIWAIYLPMVPAIAALGLRHRSLRCATLVNPPIPGGGLAGESKGAIAELLVGTPEFTAATLLVEPGPVADRCRAVEVFRREHSLDYPIVLKPDIGERGRGVAIAGGEDDVRRYFDLHAGRTLAQAFVPGDEFGLFYTRLPDAPKGELFSIARKSPRFVVGDGLHSLEWLILADRICLPVAEKLFVGNAARLDWIPAKGERVRVTQLGTHSLGCRFLVGEDLRTPALESAVDRLCQHSGLDFGRFDVRAESEEALREGRFRVLEFNGLTGEAAHLYDPRHSLAQGLAILRDQWRRAFAIGAAHRAQGHRPLSFGALAALVRKARRGE